MEFRKRLFRLECCIGWGLVALGGAIAVGISAFVTPKLAEVPFIWTLGPLVGAIPFLFGLLNLNVTAQRVRTYAGGIEVDGEHFTREDTIAFVTGASSRIDVGDVGFEGVLFFPFLWLLSKLVGWTHGLQVLLTDPEDDRHAVLFLPDFVESDRLEAELRRLGFTPSPLEAVYLR